MKKPDFTDEEYSFIHDICLKADPINLMTQTKNITQKIQEYGNAQQKFRDELNKEEDKKEKV